MKIEDVIESLNRHIEYRRSLKNITAKGHLVLQKIVIPNPTFKAYKEYKVILWFVDGNRKHELLTIKNTYKILDNTIDKVEKDVDIELCNLIFNWIGSESYNKVLTSNIIDKGEV